MGFNYLQTGVFDDRKRPCYPHEHSNYAPMSLCAFQ